MVWVKSGDNSKYWAAFVLFFWLHLSPELLSFPWTQYEAVSEKAANYIELQVARDPDRNGGLSAEEIERSLINSIWFSWICTFVLVVGGILVSFSIFTKSSHWPGYSIILVLLCSILYIPNAIGFWLDIFGKAESWVGIIGNLINEQKFEALFVLYMMALWPIYLLPLLMISILEIRQRRLSEGAT